MTSILRGGAMPDSPWMAALPKGPSFLPVLRRRPPMAPILVHPLFSRKAYVKLYLSTSVVRPASSVYVWLFGLETLCSTRSPDCNPRSLGRSSCSHLPGKCSNATWKLVRRPSDPRWARGSCAPLQELSWKMHLCCSNSVSGGRFPD